MACQLIPRTVHSGVRVDVGVWIRAPVTLSNPRCFISSRSRIILSLSYLSLLASTPWCLPLIITHPSITPLSPFTRTDTLLTFPGMQLLYRHISALGIFGTTALLQPLYGVGELPQVTWIMSQSSSCQHQRHDLILRDSTADDDGNNNMAIIVTNGIINYSSNAYINFNRRLNTIVSALLI
jgi:hypothetical protein